MHFCPFCGEPCDCEDLQNNPASLLNCQHACVPDDMEPGATLLVGLLVLHEWGGCQSDDCPWCQHEKEGKP